MRMLIQAILFSPLLLLLAPVPVVVEVNGFNSNLAPPWLVSPVPPLKRIPPLDNDDKSSSSATDKSKPKKKTSNDNIDSSSNSESPANKGSETTSQNQSSKLDEDNLVNEQQDKSVHQQPRLYQDEDDDEEENSHGIQQILEDAGIYSSNNHPNGAYFSSSILATNPSTNIGTYESYKKSIKVPSSLLSSSHHKNKPFHSSVIPVRSLTYSLSKICRLSSLPRVALVHIIGTYVMIRIGSSSSSPLLLLPLLRRTLLQPSMLLVLLASSMIDGYSKMFHDDYDSPTKVDIGSDKRTLPYLYTGLLTVLAPFLPGKFTRGSVFLSSLLIFWYTNQRKPNSWMKNVSHAGPIALAPFTSAAAAAAVGYRYNNSYDSLTQIFGSVWRMCTVLFLADMGREIWKDVLNEYSDREVNVKTVPVVYGKRVACRMVVGLLTVMSLLTNIGPLLGIYLWNSTVGGGESATGLLGRRFLFGLIGNAMMFKRAVEIVKEDGVNLNVIKRAVDEATFAQAFLLASFV